MTDCHWRFEYSGWPGGTQHLIPPCGGTPSTAREYGMAHAQLPIVRRRFGETTRKDWWWLQPAIVVVLLSLIHI